ncbi:MAG: VanW family protein [Candidatus Veblenbacteria bacterium]|nr:VanW family protein [Candidatus Veblenbacteria bacterium]
MATTAKTTRPARRAPASVALPPPVTAPTRQAVLLVVAVGVGTVFVIFGSLAFYQLAFAGRIFPGVAVGAVSLAGRTPQEAQALLADAWNSFAEQGIPLVAGEQQVTLAPVVSSPGDPDLAYELIRFDATAASEAAYAVGRQGNWLGRLFQPVWVSIMSRQASELPAEVELPRVVQFIRDSLPGLEQPPQPAQLVVDLAGNVLVTPEASGVVIKEEELRQDLLQRVATLSSAPVEVQLVAVTPALTQGLVARLVPTARNLLRDVPLGFAFEQESWQAEPAVWDQWLGAELDKNSEPRLAFLSERAEEFFFPIEEEVNQAASDARFEVQNGRVVAFQGSRQGRTVDRPATLAASLVALQEGKSEPVALVVATTEPTVTTAETNDIGISEVIGVGRSSFKGSPPNRRHNIRVGAAALNGLLVKAGEEFSLLKALLPVEASTGYLPELVIKGNRTIPEYGGGLCQIGTTTFRAALGSGLPITARRNHSYRVVYYEPAGTDATIYDPAPDFKFMNDTGNTMLIQTRIEGDDLIFEFWGRPDGREVSQSKPRIFNVVSPPPAKLVETEDLPVGEKKCTERPHTGADAEFTYAVTYPNGETKEEVFKSHYIPWQEVCLIGVPKGTLTPPEGEAPVEGEPSGTPSPVDT